MKRWSIAAVVLVAGGTAAMAIDANSPPAPVLTMIDTVPTKIQLDGVFPTGQALPGLSAIATDGSADTGFRLRAIRALAEYCEPCSSSDLAYQTLGTVISQTKSAGSGERLLLLRAALETVGRLHVLDDVSTLKQLLNHSSRDIRATAARMLRDLCATGAAADLRVRYSSETTEQVKLAISEALRVLGQCTPTP